ncbi:serine/threonine-protein kinase PINK1, mitochondrial-like isoform X1 [Lytechinus variegatus]|uniref:serine/threonine-protein kinase PINK1, mitochondrial-like isoform X1 n=1 Tax=Lytechinus variegatus TaxID=7654 RepID=UPI001BB0FBAB|nr:serine/threonine-protein kinase PINK1, mitochondrial-like isoform X1 [Lytechinus variegatus]
MSLRHGLQTIIRVVRRRVQQQAQQHAHGHAGRQKPDVAIPDPARHYSARPNVVASPKKSQNLANRAAQVWRLTPASLPRIPLASGIRNVPLSSRRPVLPLLLGFAGIGFVNQEQVQNSGHGEAARNCIDLDTAIELVQSIFKNNNIEPEDDHIPDYPSKLAGYTLSKTIIAKGTEGVVFGAKKQVTHPPCEEDEEFADPSNGNLPVSNELTNGGVGQQQNEELPVCDDKECNLALKMMFNYNVGSTPADVFADYEAERLPLLMAKGSFSRSNRFKGDTSRPKDSLHSSHPNIVLMHEAFVDDVRVPCLGSAVSMFDMALPARLNPIGAGADITMFIVMKRYRTSLRDYLDVECGLSDRTLMVIVAQLLEAVCYLGNQGVIHRDLKSNNILVDYEEVSGASPHVVVADFGCALSLRGRNLMDSVSVDDRNRQGNSALMAPEVKKGYRDSCLCYHDYLKADVWAVGAIIYEVCGQKNPFYCDRLNNDGHESGNLPQLQSQAVGLKIVTELLLEKDPKQRPSAQVAANILHLFLWQPSVSSLVRLCQGQSSVNDELSVWIIKVCLLHQVEKGTALTHPFRGRGPGGTWERVEENLVATFLNRVATDSLIDATQRLVERVRPRFTARTMGIAQLADLMTRQYHYTLDLTPAAV